MIFAMLLEAQTGDLHEGKGQYGKNTSIWQSSPSNNSAKKTPFFLILPLGNASRQLGKKDSIAVMLEGASLWP